MLDLKLKDYINSQCALFSCQLICCWFNAICLDLDSDVSRLCVAVENSELNILLIFLPTSKEKRPNVEKYKTCNTKSLVKEDFFWMIPNRTDFLPFCINYCSKVWRLAMACHGLHTIQKSNFGNFHKLLMLESGNPYESMYESAFNARFISPYVNPALNTVLLKSGPNEE